MQLIASHTSPYARKVRIALHEKNISYILQVNNPWEANSPVADFNPLGKVPVLIAANGEKFFDSPIICEYLESLDLSPDLVPRDRHAAVHVRQLEALADGITDSGVAIILEHRRPADKQFQEWTTRQLGKVVRGLEALDKIAANRTWLYGDTLSIADIAAGCMMLWVEFRLPHLAPRTRYMGLAALTARLETRPSFVSTPIIA